MSMGHLIQVLTPAICAAERAEGPGGGAAGTAGQCTAAGEPSPQCAAHAFG